MKKEDLKKAVQESYENGQRADSSLALIAIMAMLIIGVIIFFVLAKYVGIM